MSNRISVALQAVFASILISGSAFALPAFPGAEGFGSETIGGRGGQVVFVTNLNDSGTGSLRAALQAVGPRTVVFRTGGTITLNSPIVITSPYVTVAGQTAPGGGIQIRHNPEGVANARAGLSADSFTSIDIQTHDVVLRYLRIRPGPLYENELCDVVNDPDVPVPPGVEPTAGRCVDQGDIQAIAIGHDAYNVVIDHCSLYWSSDEVIDQMSQDITIQWSIVAEGMNYVLYDGYFATWQTGTYTPPSFNHAKGIITGDYSSAEAGEISGRMSLHHNLWAHHNGRAPQMGANCPDPEEPEACFSDVVNNVTYNWDAYGLDVHNAIGNHFSNVVGNFFKSGPDSPFWNPSNPSSLYSGFTLHDWTDAVWALPPRNYGLQVYLDDNRRAVSGGTTADVPVDCVKWNTALNQWQLCNAAVEYGLEDRLDTPEISTSSAEDAYVDVLDDAGAHQRLDADGAWLNTRDATDTRVLADVVAGTGGMINSFADFEARGGWPTLAAGTAPTDTDSDGMPDAWETAQCINANGVNPNADPDGDVYTNIEEFLNGTDATPDHDGDGIPTGCDVGCSDGFDNDGDGLIDHPADPGCSIASDNFETGGCGLLGIEPLPLLLWSAWARRRRISAA